MPQPAAMRRLREACKSSGFARSSGVMERMIAALRSIMRSSMSISSSFELLMPGNFERMPFNGPIFFTCRNCSKRSLKSILFCIMRSAVRAADFSSIFACASSMRDSTSPMPRIRLAIRSGWKTSRSSIFSPVPANLMGLPVMALTESAAPPRVSPSSFVKITPVMSSRSSNDFATFTASWPVMASTTSRISVGFTASFIFFSSFMSASSICRRPAVSMMT